VLRREFIARNNYIKKAAAELYTFFSAAHETFSKIDLVLGHEASLSKQEN
jgi:hypothetical protein